MNKLAVIITLTLTACGADVEGACQNYVDAWIACIDEAYAGDTTGTIDTLKDSTSSTCDAYADVTDKETADLLNCYADTIDAGDCSTVDGYTAAVTAISTDCAQ